MEAGDAGAGLEETTGIEALLDTLGGTLRMTGKTSGVFSVAGSSRTFTATAGGLFAETNGVNSVRLENLGVDIGASKTDINIMRGNASYFQREIFMAGNDLTEADIFILMLEMNDALGELGAPIQP